MNKIRCGFAGVSILWLAGPLLQAGGVVDASSTQTFTVGANPSITVHNTDGRIYVYGSEDNQIVVKAYKRAFSKERLDKIAVNVAQNGDAISVDAIYPPAEKRLFADRSGTVELTLLVPQKCAVTKLELSQGEVYVEGIRGPGIDVQLTGGRITFLSCFSPTRVSVGTGGIDIIYNWWEESAFSFDAAVTKGDIILHLPPKIAALDLDAAAGKGSVRDNFTEDQDETEDAETLKTQIGGGSDIVFKLRTKDGNIRIVKSY